MLDASCTYRRLESFVHVYHQQIYKGSIRHKQYISLLFVGMAFLPPLCCDFIILPLQSL